MSATVDPSLTELPLTGPALVTFSVAVTAGWVTFLTLMLRTYHRVASRTFGVDDALMFVGQAIFDAQCGLSARACQAGLGHRDKELNAAMVVDSIKFLMLSMIVYLMGALFVRCGICYTLLRVCSGVQTRCRVAIVVVMAVVAVNSLASFTALMLMCRPIAANWDVSLRATGTCAGVQLLLAVCYISSAVTIATDLAMAVLPGVILWGTQMKTSVKLSMYVLMAFGATASISTIIRFPYFNAYRNPTDDLAYHAVQIALWSVVETFIGLIAGSLPHLRAAWCNLVRDKPRASRAPADVSPSTGLVGGSDVLVTFGGSGSMNRGGKKPGRVGAESQLGITTVTDGGNTARTAAQHTGPQGEGWHRLQDESDAASGGRKTEDMEDTAEAAEAARESVEEAGVATRGARSVRHARTASSTSQRSVIIVKSPRRAKTLAVELMDLVPESSARKRDGPPGR